MRKDNCCSCVTTYACATIISNSIDNKRQNTLIKVKTMRIIVLVIFEHGNRVIFSAHRILWAILIPIPNTRVFSHTQKWVYSYPLFLAVPIPIPTRNFIPEPRIARVHQPSAQSGLDRPTSAGLAYRNICFEIVSKPRWGPKGRKFTEQWGPKG
jgi:hypothetical protein